jgi:hypothetical protein
MWAAIGVAIVVVLVLVASLARRKQQQKSVKGRFGREYERTVAKTGSPRQAVSELRAREKRRQQLDIRPLEPRAAQRFTQSWEEAQTRFVDYPGEAIRQADSLVAEVMRERGYPVEDFEQRAADISVDHASVLDNYRAAHATARANDEGKATTEELRRAMVHYRALFQELLETE